MTAQQDELIERLFGATIGSLELLSVYVGKELSLYETLGQGALTSDELADAAGIDARYAREWCEQQAVAGFLEAEGDDEASRRFSIPEDHRDVFLARESEAYVVPFAPMVAGIAGAIDQVVDAFRTGAGVEYARYGAPFRDGQGAINRPAFHAHMKEWLSAAPAIAARLDADPPARIVDLGCGQGFSTVAIARSFAKVLVDGIDVDEPSIDEARRHAATTEVSDRLTFDVADAQGLKERGPYDLVCIFEALHDMSRPVEVLQAARAALTPQGSLFLVDERVADSFTAPGDEVERIMYGWSVLCCLPVSRSESPSAALGTVLRASTVRDLAAQAGFESTETLDIDNDFFRFYRLS